MRSHQYAAVVGQNVLQTSSFSCKHWLLSTRVSAPSVAEVVLDVMTKLVTYRSVAQILDRNHFGGHP